MSDVFVHVTYIRNIIEKIITICPFPLKNERERERERGTYFETKNHPSYIRTEKEDNELMKSFYGK